MNPASHENPKYRSSRSAAALLFIVALLVLLLLVTNHNRKESSGTVVPETLRRRFAPILKYLSVALQIPCALRIPESYEHMVELFHED